MASTQEVYDSLKSIANKAQRGFVTPLEFNTLAPVAQTKIYNRLFAKIAGAEMGRKRGVDAGRDRSTLKQYKEDAAFFAKKASILSRNAQGNFDKPDDLGKIISIKVRGHILSGVIPSVPVDVIYDEEKLEYVLGSTLSKPTEDKPVAFISDQIYLYPASVNQIEVRYYKLPQGLDSATGARVSNPPTYGYTIVSGKESFNAANSVDFELPDHYLDEVVHEMAAMIGVSMRDANLYTFGTNQQAKQQ